MKLKVPAEVRHAIKDVDLAKFGRLKRDMNGREIEKKRLEAIDRLRQSRNDRLLSAAAFVFAWRDAYADTGEARRICEMLGESAPVPIFGARFWKGEPTDDRHCWAVLSIADGPLAYEERYNSVAGSHAAVRTLIADPAGLVATVHPDYLEQCKAHLVGPDAWKFILRELERLKKAHA